MQEQQKLLSQYLPTPYEQLIHKSRYARWLDNEGRREEWPETVERYITFITNQCSKKGYAITDREKNDLRQAILATKILPSMRLMMTAGKPAELDNIAAYNCAYVAINNKRAFAEALYILMNGTGVGFSCERQEISELPYVPSELKPVEDTIVVADSKIGWAKALKKFISSLYDGDIPKVDYSKLRPAGARLKTFGGRASGPEPFRRLFEFITATFRKASSDGGRRLNSLEVHDIMCTIGEVVVVGGVRRSALISLSNLSDTRMRHAKDGQWWIDAGHRRISNNSVAYTEKPTVETFMEEWLSLIRSKSGERGIFNRVAAQKQAAKWGRRSASLNYGTNPCSEIILRDKQFCNLTTVIARYGDTFETLKEKIKLASILGTIQASLSEFNFLSDEWKRNTEEERLLGVSLNGIMDNEFLGGKLKISDSFMKGNKHLTLEDALDELREHARKINEQWAEKLGTTPAAAITCVKPEGSTSQLVNCASGIHPRHSQYYVRTVRMDKKDPISQFLKDQGIPCEDDQMAKESTYVFAYPISSDGHSVTRDDITAMQQLELWLTYQRHWCEHKPSITVNVRDDEWLTVGSWVYDHFDEVSGIAFLPYSDHAYQQAPYQPISKEEYDKLKAAVPAEIDWTKLMEYEKQDTTTGTQELACASGFCELSSL